MQDRRDRDHEKWWLIPDKKGRGRHLELPEPFFNRYSRPDRYDPGPALISAVNIALLLGQPLLLTGEPGSGKTSLAYWLANQMGLERPLVQIIKSFTTGKDLLYSFDDLARFRDAHRPAEVAPPAQTYLELNALGRAILFSAGPDGRLDQIGHEREAMHARLHSDLFAGTFPAERRQVVLIDELDKAPRDTPNDLLSEIERMEFRIPEVGVAVRGDPKNRAAVVITSNSDKSLPEAFLRRCVYHNIPPPDEIRRREIVRLQRPELIQERPALAESAMTMFDRIHKHIGREGRRPGVAEMLGWLDTIHAVYPRDVNAVAEDEKAFGVSLSALVKTETDLALVLGKLGLDRKRVGLG
jgi:MoxR-like ATPase